MTTSSIDNQPTEMPESIVRPEELDFYVQSVRPFQVHEIGTDHWCKQHEIVLKLNQQAHLEMCTHQEELVKELLVTADKLPTLVHELYSVQVWRTKVLPKLLLIDGQPATTFLMYSVLFHEATAVALLESTLYHPDGCEALRETALDLIDYCAAAVTRLIGLVNNSKGVPEAEIDGNQKDELDRQQREIFFKTGLRCLTILGYLADKLDLLPLSAVTRLVQVHDIPCVISEILHLMPWRRLGPKSGKLEKFIDEQWTAVQGEALFKLTKVEAQTWLCFRQLLFHPAVMRHYPINAFRQRELAKCQGLMHDVLLDQLPPLAELKHHLCTLQVAGNPDTHSNSLLLEELPVVQQRILDHIRCAGGFRKLVQLQAAIFLHKTADEVQRMAAKLNEAYNTDAWSNVDWLRQQDAEREEKAARNSGIDQQEDNASSEEIKNGRPCETCGKVAQKKCFQCKRVYYCSRECQVRDWPKHKAQCN